MDPRTGFTGVDWSARPAERLRADLMAGAGPIPLGDCAQAWASAADDLAALVIRTRRAAAAISAHWDSPGASQAVTVLGRLPGWLDALARRAQQERDLARAAMSAVEAARLSMPAAAVLDDARARVVALGNTIGFAAMMTGGVARSERALAESAAAAARVMADYERSSTEAATTPRPPLPAPVLTRADGASAPATASRGASGGAGGAVAASVPRVLGAFSAPRFAGGRVVGDARSGDGQRQSQTAAGDPAHRVGGVGPVAPPAGTAGSSRGASASTDTAFTVPLAAVDDASDEPLTWAELTTHDQVRVCGEPTKDSDRTTV
ncbi:hypothetical protein GOARA_050_00180 [Gordonia araii NBRC 100433]|uniref:PPE domain-containing protein n=1 Tax=Gordonia araii NBRC 100433 TaxID=1073574 RepID=G7H281_9ACTN|nr:PPE domain-containing protein [Gordonia araii]NNG97495.1 PPE domain-containing protein [Gordonia araii NBRC 100433]GAB09956.1 hypothetical protein GOARA_050_00180 [Gordonia araii NBRC 100433]